MSRNRNFEEGFKAFTEKHGMFHKGDSIVVGVSGGADSVCLLHLLNRYREEYGYSLIAVHVNHGIRGEEANRDAVFTENFCRKLGVPFRLFTVDCPAEAARTKEGLEECGRRLRYECFSAAVSGENVKIATAHNANDNAETVLFNMARGSSLKGVCGIPTVRGNIIRPLLFASRSEIEAYCENNSLSFVTDSTNLQDDYARNKIRHRVIPVLKEINSDSVEAVSRLSADAKECFDYISSEAEKQLETCRIDDGVYFAENLSELHSAVKKAAIVKLVFDCSGKVCDSFAVERIVNLLRDEGTLQVFSNCFVSVKNGRLTVFRDGTDSLPKSTEEYVVDSFPCRIDFGNYTVSVEKCSKKIHENLLDNQIDCDKLKGTLILRSRRAGDVFTLPHRKVTKSLKKLFNEADIPVAERDILPVLCDGNGVVWIYGFGVNAHCCADESSKNIILLGGERV